MTGYDSWRLQEPPVYCEDCGEDETRHAPDCEYLFQKERHEMEKLNRLLSNANNDGDDGDDVGVSNP